LNKRRWNDLCGEAEVQEEPSKFEKLANQITRILDAAKQSARVLTDAEIQALAQEPARH